MSTRRLALSALAAAVCIGLLCSCSLLSSGPGVLGIQLESSNQRADAEMQHIETAVKNHDAAALKSLFSKTARAKAYELDSGITKFLAVFPSGFKNLGEPDGGPGEVDESNNGQQTVLLEGNYKVRANAKTYELYFAYYSINQADDPNAVGLYALAVAPYNAKPGTNPTAASKALFSFENGFSIVDHRVPGTPSVYVYSPQQ